VELKLPADFKKLSPGSPGSRARWRGDAIDVVVDFLMPRDAEIVRNDPALISDLAVQRADGADLAMQFYQLAPVTGPMPDGGMNRVEIAVCSIPALQGTAPRV
jgi:hypothetical protein